MGRYATWGRCLDCQADIGSGAVCPQCGLVQNSAEANVLRWHLLEAERALIAARQSQRPPHGPPLPASPYPSALPRPVAAARPAPSTSAVLLGLGAVCLVVAAVVFVSVAWSSLSIGAKAAILLAVTAGIGALAWWGLLRGLRGSSETFACLFVVLGGLDFAAGREGGLLGERLSDDATAWITAGIVVAAGTAWARLAVTSRVGRLSGPQVLASLGVLWLSMLALAEEWTRTEYVGFAAALVIVAVALIAARLAVWTIAVGALVVAAVMLAVAFVASLDQVLDVTTFDGLWSTGAAAGWAVCLILAATAASAGMVPTLLRRCGAVVAMTGLALLVLRPLDGAPRNQVLAALAAAAVVLSLATVVAGPVWRLGTRVALVPVVVGVLAAAAPAVLLAAARIVLPALDPWQHGFGRRVHIDRYFLEIDSRPQTVGLALFATLLAVWLAVRLRPPSAWSAVLLATPCLGVSALGHAWPLWGVVVVVAMLALLAGIVALAARSEAAAWVAGGWVVLVLTAAAGSEVTTAVAAGAVCIVLAGMARWADDDAAAALAAAGSVAFGGLAVAATLAARDLTDEVSGYALVGVAAAVLVAAQARVRGTALRARIGVEAGAVVVGTAGVGIAAHDPAVQLPICLTVAGASLAAVGLLREDRRIARAAGGVVLVAATWSRLLSQDVSVVEAYTLPTAVVLCALGVWRVQTNPDASTVTSLMPGLALLLLPSLIAAIPDPTSLRALLLGVGSLAVLLAGAVLRWAAPLVMAAGTLLVLAVVNIAPYANAVPRWVLFGLAGAALLYLGVTWERRLRNARTLIMAVETMR